MPLNVIDISSWQFGLDLAALYRDNPSLDGVIVKSTGGISNVQTTCDGWAQWLMENGKPWGFYHFLDDDYKHATGREEAEYWVKHCRNYFGHGTPWADYEKPATGNGTGYLLEFLETVYALTGIKAGVYASLSVIQSQDFTAIAAAGYPLWVAQYANMDPVSGFLENPWQKGSVAPFARYVMHQYTSCGHLNGYSHNLDFDKYYGSFSEWSAMAHGDSAPAPTPATLKPADPEIVSAVLMNEYGTEAEGRSARLRAAGYDPQSVQEKINQLYVEAGKIRPIVAQDAEYLNSIVKILRSLQ